MFVNTSGWQTSLNLLRQAEVDVDVVVVQEHHRGEYCEAEVKQHLKVVGWQALFGAAKRTEKGGTTGGMLIAARRHVGLAVVELEWVGKPQPHRLLVASLRVPGLRGFLAGRSLPGGTSRATGM